MKEILIKAIITENEPELSKYLDWNNKNIDTSNLELILKALKATWHSQHEDLVNFIYLNNLIDDSFIEPIMDIALNKDVYRCYDDELESTLRKCVHVLKALNSDRSKLALKKLENTNNTNVMIILSMYE